MSDDPNQIRAKLESEYAKVRKDLGELHVAYEALMAAGPEDDISELLKDLEDEVKEARRRPHKVGGQRPQAGPGQVAGATGLTPRPPA